MTNYAKGAARERQFAERLTEKGWSVTRSAGSHGPQDLVACKAGFLTRYYQIKSSKAGPYAGFGPSDRTELLDEAGRAGAEPLLVWWPGDRNGPRTIPPDAWPSA